MVHQSKSGNILGFVLVGVLFISLLLGGIFIIRHRISYETASRNSSTQSEKTPAVVSSGQDKSSNEKSDSVTANNQALEKALDSQAANKNSQATGEQSSSGSSAVTTTPASGNTAAHLPATGPSGALLSYIGGALLSGMSVAYAYSRRCI